MSCYVLLFFVARSLARIDNPTRADETTTREMRQRSLSSSQEPQPPTLVWQTLSPNKKLSMSLGMLVLISFLFVLSGYHLYSLFPMEAYETFETCTIDRLEDFRTPTGAILSIKKGGWKHEKSSVTNPAASNAAAGTDDVIPPNIYLIYTCNNRVKAALGFNQADRYAPPILLSQLYHLPSTGTLPETDARIATRKPQYHQKLSLVSLFFLLASSSALVGICCIIRRGEVRIWNTVFSFL